MSAQVTKSVIYQNGAVVLLARVLDNTGQPAEIPEQLDFATLTADQFATMTAEQFATLPLDDISGSWTISIVVTNLDARTSVTMTPAPMATDVLFGTLQTNDPRWIIDKIGFNFLVIVPASYFPIGSARYQIDVSISPTDGDPLPIIYQVQTLQRFAA